MFEFTNILRGLVKFTLHSNQICHSTAITNLIEIVRSRIAYYNTRLKYLSDFTSPASSLISLYSIPRRVQGFLQAFCALKVIWKTKKRVSFFFPPKIWDFFLPLFSSPREFDPNESQVRPKKTIKCFYFAILLHCPFMFLFFSAFLHTFRYEAHKKQHHTHFMAMMMMMIIDCDMIAISSQKISPANRPTRVCICWVEVDAMGSLGHFMCDRERWWGSPEVRRYFANSKGCSDLLFPFCWSMIG